MKRSQLSHLCGGAEEGGRVGQGMGSVQEQLCLSPWRKEAERVVPPATMKKEGGGGGGWVRREGEVRAWVVCKGSRASAL